MCGVNYVHVGTFANVRTECPVCLSLSLCKLRPLQSLLLSTSHKLNSEQIPKGLPNSYLSSLSVHHMSACCSHATVLHVHRWAKTTKKVICHSLQVILLKIWLHWTLKVVGAVTWLEFKACWMSLSFTQSLFWKEQIPSKTNTWSNTFVIQWRRKLKMAAPE